MRYYIESRLNVEGTDITLSDYSLRLTLSIEHMHI